MSSVAAKIGAVHPPSMRQSQQTQKGLARLTACYCVKAFAVQLALLGDSAMAAMAITTTATTTSSSTTRTTTTKLGYCTSESDIDCKQRCVEAASAGANSCTNVSCRSDYESCSCGGASVLHVNGSCIEAADHAANMSNCSSSINVTIHMGQFFSPDLQPADLSSGTPSVAYMTLLRFIIASAVAPLSADPGQLALEDVSIAGSAAGTVCFFDLHFRICLKPGMDRSTGPREFERYFRLAMYDWVSFQGAEARLIRFEGGDPEAAHHGSGDGPAGRIRIAEQDTYYDIDSAWLIHIAALAIIAVLAASGCGAVYVAMLHRKRRAGIGTTKPRASMGPVEGSEFTGNAAMTSTPPRVAWLD